MVGADGTDGTALAVLSVAALRQVLAARSYALPPKK